MALAALSTAATALAQDAPLTGDRRATWQAVHTARAREALASDLDGVIAEWSALATARLTVADPALGEALYELGELRWTAGDILGARDALDTCIRQTAWRQRCAELRGRIDLEVDAIRAIPQHWTFDDADHGLFHPRAFWERGSIKLDRLPDGGVLAWTTRVDARGPDQLVAGFDRPSPPPRQVAIEVTSRTLSARLSARLQDDLGRQVELTPVPARLPAGRRTRVVLPLGPAELDGLDLTRLHRLVLLDVTARDGELGDNTLYLHDLVIE